ncbi:phage terminase small subunit P27 family [Burkholderia sp. Bp9142]|uniref:phage terminase small subunit P27 family n=1 Tax=Burkholderia sp. Bp9142 TaxID=2184573 RepID=UPI000F5AE9BF|nr:phage terminase small subunit P27 family [Burkholderia sp. Bp9142]RQR29406.1 phage terminase small subunit P27 family [Burkholderia sp. Bp9142]
MRGRKPTPTALKIARGNPGKRPLPENEPMHTGEATAPEWLSAQAAAHWPIVAKQLGDAGVLTSVDTAALALYCEAFARWKHANDQVVKYGPVIKAPSGFPVQSPYLAIANRAHEQMTKLLIEFGMTPSSRSRVTKVPSDDIGLYAAFVKRPRGGES